MICTTCGQTCYNYSHDIYTADGKVLTYCWECHKEADNELVETTE